MKGTDLAAARRALEEGVAVARRVGDRSVLSEGLRELGYLYSMDGDLTAAVRVGEEALAEARAIGSLVHKFLALLQLALYSCLQDDPAKAKRYCVEAWALGRDTGAMAAGFVLLGFGLADCFGGQLGRGVRLLAAFDAFARQRGVKLTSAESEPLVIVYKQALEKARAQLDPAAFEAALTEGQQMTVEQAIALATEDDREDAPLPEAGRGPDAE